jgi:hypothetical protein
MKAEVDARYSGRVWKFGRTMGSFNAGAPWRAALRPGLAWMRTARPIIRFALDNGTGKTL